MPNPSAFSSAKLDARHQRLLLKSERGRLNASDWEQAALEMIADVGVSAVGVEPLAKRLGVTKGSFYWHFATREALLSAALKRWSEDDTQDVLTRVSHIDDAKEQLRTLFRVSSRTVKLHKIYSALIKAVDSPIVGPMIERLSEHRLRTLSQLFERAGLAKDVALHRARLAYAAYIGFLQMSLQLRLPRLSAGEFDAYVEHVIETLVP